MKFKLVLEGELELNMLTQEEYVTFRVSSWDAIGQIAQQAKDQGGFACDVDLIWNPIPKGRLMVVKP
jgi:hypothetical protein